MVPVLMLCIAAFVVTAGAHLLAIVGLMQALPSTFVYALFGFVLLGFAASIFTHPRSESQHGHTHLGVAAMFGPMQPALRIGYGVLWGYSMLAAIASAPLKSGESVPLNELLDRPYFLTAFLLVFAIGAVAASHSAVLMNKQAFGLNQP